MNCFGEIMGLEDVIENDRIEMVDVMRNDKKIENHHAFLFRQVKMGVDGPIIVYKIRTIREDGNYTWCGKFLRKNFIDELPQLYNILIKRNMDWVGHRPPLPEEYRKMPEDIKMEMGKNKPALFSHLYAENDMLENKGDFKKYDSEWRFEKMRQWFKDLKSSPNKTKLMYMFYGIKNIIFNRYRGV
jgi:hypothetical protein